MPKNFTHIRICFQKLKSRQNFQKIPKVLLNSLEIIKSINFFHTINLSKSHKFPHRISNLISVKTKTFSPSKYHFSKVITWNQLSQKKNILPSEPLHKNHKRSNKKPLKIKSLHYITQKWKSEIISIKNLSNKKHHINYNFYD